MDKIRMKQEIKKEFEKEIDKIVEPQLPCSKVEFFEYRRKCKAAFSKHESSLKVVGDIVDYEDFVTNVVH